VYLGPRRGTARMVVYDKQHERQSRKLPNIGPSTRYELRLRAASGVTLRDASDPAGVFWHYASPDFLPRPDGVPAWAPDGSGFDLERTPPPLPGQRLLTRIERSAELRALVTLAESVGPYGVELLCSRIRAMGRGAGGSPAGTLSPRTLAPPPPADVAPVSTQH
jgi:hypothetical protein